MTRRNQTNGFLPDYGFCCVSDNIGTGSKYQFWTNAQIDRKTFEKIRDDIIQDGVLSYPLLYFNNPDTYALLLLMINLEKQQ